MYENVFENTGCELLAIFFMPFCVMYDLIGAILFSTVLLGSSSNNARNYFAALMEH